MNVNIQFCLFYDACWYLSKNWMFTTIIGLSTEETMSYSYSFHYSLFLRRPNSKPACIFTVA